MTKVWFGGAMAACVLLIACGCGEQPSAPSTNTAPAASDQHAVAGPYAALGVMVGEVTAESALVQVRLAGADRLVDGDLPGAEGVVEFSLKPAEAGEAAEATTQLIEAKPERDFIARAHFTGLKPGARYT